MSSVKKESYEDDYVAPLDIVKPRNVTPSTTCRKILDVSKINKPAIYYNSPPLDQVEYVSLSSVISEIEVFERIIFEKLNKLKKEIYEVLFILNSKHGTTSPN